MLGIDVSKAHLVCSLLDPTHRTLLWEQTVPNSPAGIAALVAQTPPEAAWVLEPTGRYRRAVARQAHAAGRSVRLAPPLKAKRFLQSVQSRAKTDRLDSRGLALYALSVPLAPSPIPSPAMERLSQLLAARKALSQSLARLKQQCAELPYAAAPLRQAMAPLKQQVRVLDQQIATARQEFPAAGRLQKVHGIGPVTASHVAATLTERSLEDSDAFVADIGLDIAVRQSGRRAGELGLTRQGDAELRRLFYLCAQSSVRAKGSPFKGQYERELKKGLSKTAAVCAVARKMARLCWSMERHGSEYDPQRVYQRPPKREVEAEAPRLPPPA